MQKSRLTEIADKAFDLSNTLEYTMSIRFVPNGFCFIVYARKSEGLLYFMEVVEPGKSAVEVLTEYAQQHPVLKSQFHQVQFMDDESLCELVPMGILQEADAEAVWRLAHGDLDSSLQLHCDSLKVLDVNVIYAVQKATAHSVQSIFPNVRMVSRQSVLVQTAILANKKNNDSNLFLNLRKGSVDVVVVMNGKLQMANSFAYHNADEFLYFILGIYDLFGLDQYKSAVSIAGVVNDGLIASLKRYLKFVQVARPSLAGEFAKIESPERFLNLFNLPLCVL